jgi:hypothetical protein
MRRHITVSLALALTCIQIPQTQRHYNDRYQEGTQSRSEEVRTCEEIACQDRGTCKGYEEDD